MSGPRLRTVVADTSALVSLAVPRADAAIGTDVPDPFQYLLTSCDVVVPPEVVAELRDITQYQDIHAAAASNVPRPVATTRSKIHMRATTPRTRDRRSASMTAKLMASSSRTRSTSTAFSPTSLVERTSRSSTPCYRARGSSRHRGSSATTPGTAI